LDARFRVPLLAYFRRRVESLAEAEDLTQEVFIRLMRQAVPPAGESVQAYIFVSAANLLKDRGRVHLTHNLKTHRSLDEVRDGASLPAALVENRTPERVLRARQTLEEFLSALQDLNERSRDIFILSRIERMHQREIAKLFGISVSAVEKHMIRALEHIATRLTQP